MSKNHKVWLLPVAGTLFRARTESTKREEVIILITAGLHLLVDLDELGGCVEEVQEFLGLSLGEIPAELEAGSHINDDPQHAGPV